MGRGIGGFGVRASMAAAVRGEGSGGGARRNQRRRCDASAMQRHRVKWARVWGPWDAGDIF